MIVRRSLDLHEMGRANKIGGNSDVCTLYESQINICLTK